MNIELSIIIAVYSETQSVIETIRRLFKMDSGYIKEIILVVAPRSTSACLEICRQLAKDDPRIQCRIQENNPGVGLAFREGIKMARGTHVVVMAADLETEPETVERMVKKVRETDCAAVSPSRWLKGGGFRGYGGWKIAANFLFQKYFMLLFKTPVSDLTLGYKLYKAGIIQMLNLESSGPEMVFESMLKIIRSGGRIEEIPTLWVRRSEGTSKNAPPWPSFVKYFKTGMKVYRSPLKARRRI